MAYINVDEVYILDNTGLQVDQTTDLPFKDAGLTESQQAQARANIGAGGTNPNLLDNPFFTINQRGFTGGSTVGYTVDRWKNDNGSAITFSGGVIGLPANANFIQPIEPDLYAELVGKTVTLSVLYSDNTIASGTITVPSSGSTYAAGTPRLAMNGTNKRFFCYPPTNISVRAFKIELGTVSTLANDTPPDYGTELLKCQRYFNRISFSSTNYPIAYGYAYSATAVRYLIPLPVKMRTTPTLALTNSFLALGTNAGTNAVTAFTPIATFQNGVLVLGTTSNHTVGISLLMTGANATLDLSADL